MATNQEIRSEDILERLGEESSPESVMSSSDAKPSLKASEGSKKAKTSSRRDYMRKRAEESEAREKRLAEEQADLTAESSLRSAIRSGTPFYGKAVSVEVLENKDGKKEVALIVLLNRTIKVVIPFGELFTYNPIDMSTVDLESEDGLYRYLARKRSFAEKLIGANISFSIMNVFTEGNNISVIGSRAAAMRRIARRAFGGDNPKIKVGSYGEAIVTAVSRHGLSAEFNGVDVVIPQYHLTLRWMLYVHEYYEIGQAIPVKVRSVAFDENGDVKKLVLDPIVCELQDARERYAMLKDGARVKGIVTNVYRPEGSRNIAIYAWLPDWEIPAKILRMNPNDFGREITAGTTLRLEVNSHDENGYVVCTALSEHGNRAMFASRGRLDR